MRRSVYFLWLGLFVVPGYAAPLPGHHLPAGAEQPVRERRVDILRLTAELAIDMRRQTIGGSVTIVFTPLKAGVDTVFLDAADIEIQGVELVGPESEADLAFSLEDRQLAIDLPEGSAPGDTVAVRIRYQAKPDTGLYFFPETKTRTAEAWNYGEGGRHYNWLPMYNDTNDRFAVDFRITVDQPYIVLGNGQLIETSDYRGHGRAYRWVQEEPIPNYLLALNVGQFVEVPLRDAEVGGRRIPLSVWTHAGSEQKAAFSFGKTPEMVEYFSALLRYDYPWSKYDQVTLRNFSGAMETATMVGFSEAALHHEGSMPDDGPELHRAYPTWTTDDTIAHELAHHWFGDLVTCRSLASIWLNESFATYMHTVWNGHTNGEDDLTYQRWRYLQRYLGYIRETGEVRPLEFFNYDASDDMYTSEITYLKGALILHLLRHVLGDQDFYRGIDSYLDTHAYSEVDSFDFQRSMEKVSGGNLNWFFEDWIRGGGGYPALKVSQLWVPDRSELDLSIAQVQAVQPFEGHFDVPIDIEIVTATGSRLHTVRLHQAALNVALPADGEPLMVVVDKGNWLIADLHQELSADQLAYQLQHGDLASALRAARQLAEDHGRDPNALEVMASVLADEARHWGLRQEAALNLGTMGGVRATSALMSALDNGSSRIRRAAAIGLGRAGGEDAARALERVIGADPAEEVVGAAVIALGGMRAPRAKEVMTAQLERESQYHDVIRHSALKGLGHLEDRSLASAFARYIDEPFNQDVRLAAIDGWVRAVPQDPALRRALRRLAHDPDLEIRGTALEKLGSLHHADDLEFLGEYAARAADPNLQKKAREAAETIAAFVTPD